MGSNYKILRKAGLDSDVFVPDVDEAALMQEEADRDWRRDQEQDPLSEVTPFGAAAAPALVEARAEAEVVEVVEVPAPGSAIEAPPPTPAPAAPAMTALVKVSAERGWTQGLADLTGNPSLEGIRCLGVCALDRSVGAGDATAALARWVAQSSDRPVLVVEAHFRDPSHAARFNVTNIGVSDALERREGIEALIQDTADENLKVLAGGDAPGFFSRGRAVSEFPALFLSLKDRFDTIIVELPAADDPSLKKLPVASLADAVVLVADPKSAPPRKLERAAESLQDSNVRLAAVLLSSPQSLSAALRRDRLAQQVQGSGS